MNHPTSSVVILSEDFTERSFPLPVVILSEDFTERRVPHPFAFLWRKGGRPTIFALLGLSLLTACSGEKPTPPPAPEVVRDVTLFTAQRTTVADYVEATGTVRASQSAQLSSQVMGTITRVNVHEGDRVRRGEVLITIDEAQQRAAYSGANAGLQASQENIAAADADYALAESTMKQIGRAHV